MRVTDARVSVSGTADPDTVWQRYTQPALWATWSPQIRSVEYGHPTLVAGTSGTVRTVGGIGIPFTVEVVDPSRRTWSWRVEALGVSLRLDHGVSAEGVTGCRTWLLVTGPPVISQAYAHGPAALALRHLVRA